MKKQMRQRLAIGFTGMLTASALVFGTVSVAADDVTVEPHDVNVGQEATGMASESILTINSVVPVTAAVAPSAEAPIVEHRDDRTE